MKTFIVIFLLLISFTVEGQTLREALLKEYPRLEDVKIIKCQASTELFIVILVKQSMWFEEILIVKFHNKKILWKAHFDEAPGAQAIETARQLFLKGINNPVFEVFDVTHTGFGYYYLYELRGRNLRLIAKTFSSDGNGGIDIKIGKIDCDRAFDLKPTYGDLNNDGFTDIVLTGDMTIKSTEGHSPYQKDVKAKKVFFYNETSKKFIENKHLRIGFSKTEK